MSVFKANNKFVLKVRETISKFLYIVFLKYIYIIVTVHLTLSEKIKIKNRRYKYFSLFFFNFTVEKLNRGSSMNRTNSFIRKVIKTAP